MSQRVSIIRSALRLEAWTIMWMVVEFGVALYAGITAHSVALIAFSLDSLIEMVHAGVLMWRLNTELVQGKEFPEALEARTARIGGAILALLAVYITVNAGWELWHHRGAEFSLPGLLITLAAIPIMIRIASKKYHYADALGSQALRGDAAESASCWYLSVVVVIALILQALVGAWWIDGVASLGVVYFIAREAKEGLEGGCHDCDD